MRSSCRPIAPDTITIRSDAEPFRNAKGGLWEGKTLYDLYAEAYMPWDWTPKLMALCAELGHGLLLVAVRLHGSRLPRRTSASPRTRSPRSSSWTSRSSGGWPRPASRSIMSTGMATEAEIDEAVAAARDGGATEIALLKCTSAYPSPPGGGEPAHDPGDGRAMGPAGRPVRPHDRRDGAGRRGRAGRVHRREAHHVLAERPDGRRRLLARARRCSRRWSTRSA